MSTATPEEQVKDLIEAIRNAETVAKQVDLRALRGKPELKAAVLAARTNLSGARQGVKDNA